MNVLNFETKEMTHEDITPEMIQQFALLEYDGFDTDDIDYTPEVAKRRMKFLLRALIVTINVARAFGCRNQEEFDDYILRAPAPIC